jgi:hypothetical protein
VFGAPGVWAVVGDGVGDGVVVDVCALTIDTATKNDITIESVSTNSVFIYSNHLLLT